MELEMERRGFAMTIREEPHKITAHLDVTITGRFHDDEASEETVRQCLEEELNELWEDVEVRLIKDDKSAENIISIHCKDCLWWRPGVVYGADYYPPQCGRTGTGRSSDDSCPDAEINFTIRELV